MKKKRKEKNRRNLSNRVKWNYFLPHGKLELHNLTWRCWWRGAGAASKSAVRRRMLLTIDF